MADEGNGEGEGEDWPRDYFAGGFDFGEGDGEWDDAEWEPPVVYVDAPNRKTVETFASQMESLGMPEDCDAPEYMPYCRMDASALLIHLCNGRTTLLQRLQDAIMAKDLNAFLDVLQNAFITSKEVMSSLRTAADAGDKEAFAEGLRSMVEEEVARLMQEAEEQVQKGRELGCPTDPICGTERRIKSDFWMTEFTLPEGQTCNAPIPVPNRPNQDRIAYFTAAHGYDHMQWEEECLYHPYLWDGLNAASDSMQEARGNGFLDGRQVGMRGSGIGIFG